MKFEDNNLIPPTSETQLNQSNIPVDTNLQSETNTSTQSEHAKLKQFSNTKKKILHNKTFLLIISLIFLVAVSISVYYQFINNQQEKNDQHAEVVETDTPRPTKTPESTPSPLTAVVKPTITTKPTPKVTVDNNHYCGKYDYTTRPPQPAQGPNPAFVYLYPSGGVANYSSLDGFQWDYDGDGVWDTKTISGKTNYTYTKIGTYNPKFRIVANNSSVSSTCDYPFEIKITNQYAFQNDTIVIDKLNFEYKVSRAKINYYFPWYDDPKLNNNSEKIFMPAFNVSSKQKFTFIGFKETYDSNFGVYETGANLDAGTSKDFHFFINTNLTNGVYEATKNITYTSGDNGTTVNQGPVINYKIILID